MEEKICLILSLFIGREKREESKSHWKKGEPCIQAFLHLAFDFTVPAYLLEIFLAILQL